MTHNRLRRFVVLLVCLLVVPVMLASSDHDKEKEKKDKDSAAAQQSHDHSTTSGSSGLQHASSAKPTPTPTPRQTHSGDVDRSRDHYTKTHVDTAHHTDVEHEHAMFDRDHFHARMVEHPDAAARARAYERYHDEHARFVLHSRAIVFVPAHRVILTRVRIVPTTYYYRRTVFYDEYGWAPPRYVYSFYPRYGLWDAVFLAFALDHLADDEYALMFYHHRYDPDMQLWLADNRRLAAENEELRIRLDAMQDRMAEIQESGVTPDPGYVPPDAQDVALSPEVIDKLTAAK